MKTTLKILRYIGIYFVAMILLVFAVTKFLNTQFHTGQHINYIPLKDLTPFMRVWTFFGKSYTYGVFLGLAELFAGLFMLFDRTRLAGLLLALGVYLNVVIIDYEFEIIGPLTHAALALVIVVLLLSGYAKDLKTFFWDMGGRLKPVASKQNKWAIIIPAAFATVILVGAVFSLNRLAASSTNDFIGTYTISHFTINNDTIPHSRGKYTDDPTIFFETSNRCVISADRNEYLGTYTLSNDSIHIKFMAGALRSIDTIDATLDRQQNIIKGKAGNKDVEIRLALVEKEYPYLTHP